MVRARAISRHDLRVVRRLNPGRRALRGYLQSGLARQPRRRTGCYVLEVKEHVGLEGLQDRLERDSGPEPKDLITTTRQRLIEQGHQQDIEQGRQRFHPA